MNLPSPQTLFEQGILSEAGLYLAEGAIVEILGHFDTTVALYRDPNTNQISHRFKNKAEKVFDGLKYVEVPPPYLLNGRATKIIRERRDDAIDFVVKLGVNREEAEIVVDCGWTI